MPRYKCTDEDCNLFNVEVTVAKVKMIYNKLKDKCEPMSPITCKECGQDLQYVKEAGPITCHLNMFESKTPAEKKEMMHKRSVEHFRKTDKGDLANYKKSITDNMRAKAEGRL